MEKQQKKYLYADRAEQIKRTNKAQGSDRILYLDIRTCMDCGFTRCGNDRLCRNDHGVHPDLLYWSSSYLYAR